MQINLPSGGTEYDARLRVMLHQYLGALWRAVDSLSSGGGGVLSGSAVITVPAGSIQHTETVSVSGVTSSMAAIVGLAPHQVGDVNSEELLSVVACTATTGTDSLTVFFSFGEPVSGPVRITYMVA